MRYFIITIVTLLTIIQAQNSVASTYSQQLVTEGRVLLFDSNNIPPIPTYSGLAAANEKFKSAVATDPTDQLANLFYAVTRLAVSYIEQGDTVGIETVRELLEAFGFTRSLEDNMDLPAYNDPPEINGVYAPPTSTPSGEEFQTFLAGDFLTLIESAIVNLNVITSSFTATLTPAETGDIFPIEIDYGDVLFYKSILHTLRAFIQIVSAYDMDINLRDSIILANADVLQIQRDLLDKYNDFLSLHTDGASQLTSARTTLLLAIDTYRAAFTFITSETDNQDDDLISFGSEEEVAEASTVISMLTELQNSLTFTGGGRHYTVTEEEWLLTFDGDANDQMALNLITDYDGNLMEGSLTDNSGSYSWVNDITGESTITIDVGFGGLCPGSATLTGALSSNSITGGTYNVTDCSGPGSGTFTGSLQYSETESLLDVNRVFGNTGKSPLDIRGILPDFDWDWDMIAGTFPAPYLNDILPDMTTELKLVNELELPVVYDVQLGSITLDGASSEWLSSFAVAEDDVYDMYMGAPAGNNISKLYAARDSTGFYWMMELDDPPANSNTTYTLAAFAETNNKTLFSIVYNGTYNLYAYDEFWTQTLISSNPDDMGAGTVVEARIPLEQFDGTVKIYVDGWSNGDFTSDVTLRLPNDADLSGSVSCDSCNGSGEIFIYIYDGSNPATSRLLGTAVLDTPGNYTVTGLPIGEEVHVFAHWDADDNGIQTYGDYTGNSGSTPVEISASGTTSDVDITTELIAPYLTGGIFAENRVYSDFFTNSYDYYEMINWVESEDKTLPVYAQNIPHSAGSIQVPIPYQSNMDLMFTPHYTYARRYASASGFDLPGTSWEGPTFPVYLDENLNGTLDLGETSFNVTIPEGSLQQLNIPEVEITGQGNPTITWQEVPEADRYIVRFWAITGQNGLGELLYNTSVSADDSSSYSFIYDGDLFNQYPALAVTVMADDLDSGFHSRSTYVTTHKPVVNLSGVMLLLLD